MSPTPNSARGGSARHSVSAPAIMIATLGLFAASCGNSSPLVSTATNAGTSPPVTSVAATTTTAAGSAGVIHGVDQAQSGTIQIIAQGSLRDPEVGTRVHAGSGSGFFIDANGLAVTNNHVVTGAATLEVFIGGDTTKSYNAQVLGVSECNDLAVIRVDTAEPNPYFDWFGGDIKAGIDVYTAGYPLGDPQFTLTRGIVAKAKAGGDLTGTSSIDHTLEHDANIQPGNSGGPLLTGDGQVIGINYAGGAQATTTEQFFAIASDLAKSVVTKLQDGDFESLGINGNAVTDDASGLAGIWVGGVAPGSPAAEAGVLPGDIVTSMNGLPVGTDGTFKDYCDVIRTAGTKPISVEVLRYDTQEVLRGEINGDKPLIQEFSFADQTADSSDATVPPAATTYSTYVPVTDDTGTLTVEVPAEWSDIITTTIADVDGDGDQLPRIEASTNLSSFESTFVDPGVEFIAAKASDHPIDNLLSLFEQSSSCTDGGTFDYDDGAFVGKYQVWEDCDSTTAQLIVLATSASAGDGTTTYATVVQVVTEADLEALDHIIATFNTNA